MSKCWYCNNELITGDNQKHFGICNKCYEEMFKNGDAIIRSLTNKIAELEKQLEEKEKLLQYGMTEIKNLHKRINDIVKRDEKLFKSHSKQIIEKIRETAMLDFKEYDNNTISYKITAEELDAILKEYQ